MITRKQMQQRLAKLETERSTWDSRWVELRDYLMPYSGRRVTDRTPNRGTKPSVVLYDNSPTRAVNTTTAGIMAGASSPARQWFRVVAANPKLAEKHAVRVWQQEVTHAIERLFRRANVYRALHQMYEDLIVFGTAVAVVTDDDKAGMHLHVVPVGEYYLGQDFNGRVNSMYRRFERTVGELVGEFGIENVSERVKSLHAAHSLDEYISVIHVIEPNPKHDPNKLDSKSMAFRSVYYEENGHTDQVLREGGFRRFPVLAPRWLVAPGDVYGRSAGMAALPDAKSLQHKHRRYGQAIDYQTMPPTQVPTALKGRELNTLPGGINYVDAASPQAGVRPLWEVNLNLEHLRASIMDDQQRIASALYADIFLMLTYGGRDSRMTATEVAERHEEKLLMIGPVIERLHNELLDPLVDMAFEMLYEAGEIPTPPEEMLGEDLSIEFVSMLAQAQRAVGVNAVDRFVGSLGAIAQFKPEVLDKFNPDEWADQQAQMLGIDPKLLVATEDAQALREARAKAQAAKEQAALMEQHASAAQSAAGAMAQSSGPMDIMGMFSGYGSPTGVEL